ncbi:cyclophilin type peptidyl-prolyl cis-trans isomerase [Nitzschia inconspicua]|uniref:Cyclophilin type peptidyl-prolyl cis-trans isomerase n=1 Tax=Nitzschia inconspicua TaxID=303405 RepID=A0A9K3LEK3_9STRA|nr:cyclophilin type peptidyl-prolyl cis-trans isomerase [Nitzschia inconspicua]
MYLSVVCNSAQALVQLNRRACLELVPLLPSIIGSVSLSPASASAATVDNTSDVKTHMPSMPENVAITDKIFMDVRIARKDGSTYVRDDLDGSFENTVLFQRIKIGLYGKQAPNHVEKFLSYIETPTNADIEELLDNPYPSYGRSTFPSLDQETGLLMGGNIPSLRVKDVAGTTALTYGNRVLPANLWIDRGGGTRISHSYKGLLTHRNLEVLPTFGITTRSQPSLDATHTVFGQVLWDEDTLRFFRDLEDIPTYSVERPSGLDDFNTGEVATTVYNAQREFFRGAAKTFGDDRVSKLYNGKLLRRMEVLQVGRL